MVALEATGGKGGPSALGRGLEILLTLGDDEALETGGLGVVRIAELLGREKSQVSRALKTLAALGWIERDEATLLYRLGWRIFALGARAGDARILDEGPPVLAALVASLHETAHLSVLDGDEVLTVLSHVPAQAVRATGWVGRRVPASCTASGRALLWDDAEAELRVRFAASGTLPGTARAPRSVDQLLTRLRAERTRRFSVNEDEFEVGLVAVAAPVRNAQGRIVAALNVSGPKYRLGPRLGRAGRTVAGAARDLSAALGHRPVVSARAQ